MVIFVGFVVKKCERLRQLIDLNHAKNFTTESTEITEKFTTELLDFCKVESEQLHKISLIIKSKMVKMLICWPEFTR